jgi:signal transduction histidine kinase
MVSDQSRRFVLNNLRLTQPILIEALKAGALHNAKKAFDTIHSLFLNLLKKMDGRSDSDGKRMTSSDIRSKMEDLKPSFTMLKGHFLEIEERYSPAEPIVWGVHGVKKIIEQQLFNIEAEFFDLHIKVTRNFPTDEIRIECDQTQIGLALLNIIKNAYQAMTFRGELTVQVKETGERVRIDITDNGKGISDELREVMFQPNISDKPGGTGLGLSMSKYVIETNHKGKINARSRQGRTTFIISLPKKQFELTGQSEEETE